MKKALKVICLSLLVCVLVPVASADSTDNIVTNPTFQTTAIMNGWGLAQLTAGSNQLAGWDIINPPTGASWEAPVVVGSYWEPPAANENTVSLSNGGISQDLNVVSGASYTLSFDLAPHEGIDGTQTVLVTFGSYSWTFTLVNDGCSRESMCWQHVVESGLVFDSNVATLTFAGLSPQPAAGVIGTVSVVDPVTPVPEPTTVILLGTGLVGVVGLARKRWR